MKIAIDAMGGDHGLGPIVEGSIQALKELDLELVLVGQEDQIRAELDRVRGTDSRLTIQHATQTVDMHESPAQVARKKRDSSIWVATNLVKSGEADAVISAGNTGAAVAAATLKLRLLKGVERAGIASALPNEFGICNILDAGANPEAKPSHLVGYAVMGSVYARHVLRVAKPTVGLMSNGEEDEKGTAFTKETFLLLKELVDSGRAPFEFLGNVEGHDLFQSKLDVCLCDGFTGNIVLKSCEATARAMATWLKIEFKRGPLRLMGAALGQGAFKAVKERTNYESYGGSPLLGVNGVCIIAHGGSSALAIQNAIRVASEAIAHRVNPHIEEALAGDA
jgi:glycerol-3-phosphate acyltransferase PlsX